MLLKVIDLGKKVFPVVLGAAAGYAYYYFIGCYGDSCPITGNPWTSTAYGAAMGALLIPWKRKDSVHQSSNHQKQTD